VRSTVRGPVISDMMDDYDRKDEALSVQWTGFQPDIRFDGYARLPLAKNWEEFRAALGEFDISGNHFLFADSEGRIGYQLAGMLPLRAAAPATAPVAAPVAHLPAEGWNHGEIWPRRLTVDEMPHRFDPPEGMMASANNRPFSANEGHYIGSEFSPPHRRDRIYEILESKEKFTAQELMDSQRDTVSIVARQIMPFMIQDIGSSEKEDHRWIRAELENWDLKMDTGSRAALLFESLFTFAARETFIDELGEKMTAEYLDMSNAFRARFFLMLEDPANRWFDDTRTEAKETRRDIILRAADRSIEFLTEKIGEERSDWTWGALHTLTIPHYADAVTKLLNVKVGPVAGSEQTVNRFGYLLSNPFAVTTIPDLRMFVDFNDPDHMYAVIHTGQSGWWGHRNYADQAKMLANAELIPIPFNMEEIKKQAVNRLSLVPANKNQE
ncbi:MAG: penicillin acylase family protein, partial [bacterium]